MSYLLKYLKAKDWIFAILSIGFIVMQVWLEIKLPDYTREITLILQTQSGGVGEIWKSGVWCMITDEKPLEVYFEDSITGSVLPGDEVSAGRGIRTIFRQL